MLKTYAADFVDIVLGLEGYYRDLEGLYDTDKFASKVDEFHERLEKIKGYSATFKLKGALRRISEIEELLEDAENSALDDFLAHVKELQRDIIESLEGEQFLYVLPTKTDFWENEEHFGAAVVEKIDAARTDIREACSCFAVGRYTATVYHCIGIMQAALIKLAQRISCSERIDLEVDDWGSVVSKLQRAVDALEKTAKANSSDADRWAEWRRLEPKYNEIISDANAVKKAWRHPSAHFIGHYDEPEATKVLGKVGDFVKDVAELLLRP